VTELDSRIEAQNQVIRHVLDFMEANGRGDGTARIYGMRRIEAELRRQFDFDERKCTCCQRWRGETHFYRQQTSCKDCYAVTRKYGSILKTPRHVLLDLYPWLG
jgi:hypothetical protein